MLSKRWRVGSLSMGLTLVLFGVAVLVAQITNTNITKYIFTFWPAIIICLGIEILLMLFLRKNDENDKIKYDVMSILFIGFILFVSVLFYCFNLFVDNIVSKDSFYSELGIYSQHKTTEATEIFPGTEELTVFNGFDRVSVITTENTDISVKIFISYSTNETEKPDEIISNLIVFEKGKKASILTSSYPYYNYHMIGNLRLTCIIYLPTNKTLDLTNTYAHIEYDKTLYAQLRLPE